MIKMQLDERRKSFSYMLTVGAVVTSPKRSSSSYTLPTSLTGFTVEALPRMKSHSGFLREFLRRSDVIRPTRGYIYNMKIRVR